MTHTNLFDLARFARKKLGHCAKLAISTSLLTASAIHVAQAADVDPDKSLFIRDTAILGQFSLNETLQKLLTDSGDFGNTPQSILDTWPGTINAGCSFNDLFNGFQSSCSTDLQDANDYFPIALTNRFDLASSDGSDCGEYRIAFANQFNLPFVSRVNFIIFEARLDNPSPQIGLEGCRPVADFWANLSNIQDINERANLLHNFYLNGIPGFDPIISIENYRGSENGSGQIRFNQRASSRGGLSWNFFEFRTQPNQGSLQLLRSTLKEAPSPTLLDGTGPAAITQAFEDAVIDGLTTPGQKLLSSSMGTLSYSEPDSVNMGTIFTTADFIGDQQILNRFDPQSNFANRIQTQLNAVGSNLTPTQVMARVNALTCAGCHSQGADLGAPIDFDSTGQLVEMLSIEFEPGETLHIEAENWTQMSGIQTESTQDVGGGLNIGWTDPGDWLRYDIPLPPSANNQYRITMRIAGETAGQFDIERPGGGATWATIGTFNTGGWQSWTTISRTVNIPAGEQGIAIAVREGGWNMNWIEIQALGGDRIEIKDTLANEFIPEREIILEAFLDNACTDPSCLDTDKDGITDNVDQCPNTPQGTVVDNVGCPIANNLIVNGDFSNGSLGWTSYIDNNANASVQVGADFHIEHALANIFNGGFEIWHVQLHQPGLTLEQGKAYQLSFDTFVDNGRTAQYQVVLEEDGNDFTNYSHVTSVNAHPGSQRVTVQFSMNEPTDFNARLTFNLGGNGDQGGSTPIIIDNVELIELN